MSGICDAVVAQAWKSRHVTASILLDFRSATPLSTQASVSTMAHGKRRAKNSPPHTRSQRSTRLQAKNNDEGPDIDSAQDSATRDESPPWLDIEGSQLPSEDVSIHSDSHKSSSPEADEDEDSDPSPDLSDLAPANPQATRARSPRWQSWQDRYLVQAVDQTRPFLLDTSQREEGWNETAKVLLRESRAVGPRSIVDRTGAACKNRFTKLMKEHRVRFFPRLLIIRLHVYRKAKQSHA